MYDYVIAGAGLFGAVFGYEASRAGKKVLVIEKKEHIGGSVYTEKISGINVHKYGPHIFHTDNEEIWDYINKFSAFNDFINTPIARYDHEGKTEIYNLPFNMYTFKEMWGVDDPLSAKKIIEEQIAHSGTIDPRDLEEQAISMVGYDIYRKLIKGYTEKQWGRPCSELPPSIIKRIPVRFEFNNNYYDSRFQGIPTDGYTGIIEKMLEGCDVRCSTDFLEDREKYEKIAKRIVYTGAVDEYFDHCFGKLEYRSLRFEEVMVSSDDIQGNAVINVTGENGPTRIVEHKHFYDDSWKRNIKGDLKKVREIIEKNKGISLSGKTAVKDDQGGKTNIVTLEYPEKYDGTNEALYPLNDHRNEMLYCKYKDLAKKKENVIFGGRLGNYSYMDMDQTILSALRTWENEVDVV